MPKTSASPARQKGQKLERRLDANDAVVVGLGAMLGAGVFVAFGPAARAAGSWLLLGLAIAGAVAYCNALASADLAARYPQAGGTYVYGRKRLDDRFGFVAGWGFVIGKTASCSAMALAFGTYVSPDNPRLWAVAIVVVMVGVNLLGVTRTVAATRVILVVVAVALVAAVIGSLLGGEVSLDNFESTSNSRWGALEAAGLLFFAFAGYARIATLGEEIKRPSVSIPWAIPRALGAVLATYVVVAVVLLLALGADATAESEAPLLDAVLAGRLDALGPVIRVGAAVATAGVLLSLLAGVSRTSLAMARNRDLPSRLDSVDTKRSVPDVAEGVIGVVVIVLVATLDLRAAIGFSSFCVLTYYAITNLSAFTMRRPLRIFPRFLNIAGFFGCVLLAFSLPGQSVLWGLVVLAVGLAGREVAVRKRQGPAAAMPMDGEADADDGDDAAAIEPPEDEVAADDDTDDGDILDEGDDDPPVGAHFAESDDEVIDLTDGRVDAEAFDEETREDSLSDS